MDLAGSERIKKQVGNHKYDESISINQSLSALSKCIFNLSKNNGGYISYRESKLTMILQKCLSGNSKTSFLLTVSPDYIDLDESISTFKFGIRAKMVTIKPNHGWELKGGGQDKENIQYNLIAMQEGGEKWEPSQE